MKEQQWLIHPLVYGEAPPELTLREKFERFHADNPHVYDAIVRLCFELKESGVHRIGIKAIFEQLRWRYRIQTQGDEYQLNNNHAPYYARLVMEQNPELDGVFELRRQKDEPLE